VGRNSTLILGAVPDPRGLVPAADVARLAEFGAEMDRRLRHTVASTTGHGDVLELPFPAPAAFDHVVIQEDIRLGERVREYRVEALTESGPQTIASGTCVGHKRIHQIAPVTAMGLRLHITQRANTPSVALAAVCSA
jgi:alpha-L-fucosidase